MATPRIWPPLGEIRHRRDSSPLGAGKTDQDDCIGLMLHLHDISTAQLFGDAFLCKVSCPGRDSRMPGAGLGAVLHPMVSQTRDTAVPVVPAPGDKRACWSGAVAVSRGRRLLSIGDVTNQSRPIRQPSHLISWQPFRSTNSTRELPRPGRIVGHRAQSAAVQRLGGPLAIAHVPIWDCAYPWFSLGVCAVPGLVSHTPGEMRRRLVCSSGSVSKTRATLRAVLWFSRQAADCGWAQQPRLRGSKATNSED
jgi:hypothetical protein